MNYFQLKSRIAISCSHCANSVGVRILGFRCTVKFLIKAPQKINFEVQIGAQLKRKKMISAQLAHCLEWRLVIGTES